MDQELPSETRYLIYNTSFARQYLALLGIEERYIVPFDPCIIYTANVVFTTSHSNQENFPSPQMAIHLRETMRDHLFLTCPASDLPTIIFIRRREVTRQIENHDEVLTALQEAFVGKF